VIFCRNVLIYFDQQARKKVVDTFYDSIVEGGYLLLGHAESLMNISTSFALRHLKNDMVYQKPILQERTAHVR
jgi:chemotaxis protein methyltransferase CheR